MNNRRMNVHFLSISIEEIVTGYLKEAYRFDLYDNLNKLFSNILK